MGTGFGWADFYRATKDSAHWSLMERAAAMIAPAGHALDLGCGAGRDTRYLLAHGWRVTAVDAEAEAIRLLDGLPQENLQTIQSTFEAFEFQPVAYDLISAQFALPFIPADRFSEVLARLKGALKPGGLFAGQFFGVHDEWNVPGSGMTFLTRAQVDDVLSDLTVKEFREEDHMGGTATGGDKHWHVFHAIAQKG